MRLAIEYILTQILAAKANISLKNKRCDRVSSSAGHIAKPHLSHTTKREKQEISLFKPELQPFPFPRELGIKAY